MSLLDGLIGGGGSITIKADGIELPKRTKVNFAEGSGIAVTGGDSGDTTEITLAHGTGGGGNQHTVATTGGAGFLAALVASGVPVAKSDGTGVTYAQNVIKLSSHSTLTAALAAAKAKGSTAIDCDTGNVIEIESLDFDGCEGVELRLGSGRGNYNKGLLRLTGNGSSGALIKFAHSLNCGIVGARIEAPNLEWEGAIVSFESDGIYGDVSGAYLQNCTLIGTATMTPIAVSATSVNVTTVATALASGPTTVALAINSGLDIAKGQKVIVQSTSSSASMTGGVVSYVGTTLTVRPIATTGSGAYTDWAISVRHVPTGVRMGCLVPLAGMGSIACRLDEVTGIRLRALTDCTAYSNEFFALNPKMIEADLATHWNPVGEGWTIVGGTTQPTHDARGREMGFDTTDPSFVLQGCTYIGGWHGDLDGLHDVGPWFDLNAPDTFTVIGGLWQGVTGAALRVSGGKNITAFLGSKFSCGKFIEFAGPTQTLGFNVPTPKEGLLHTDMCIGLGTYGGAHGQLVAPNTRYTLGDAEVSGCATAGRIARNGSQTCAMSGDTYGYNPANSSEIRVSSTADGQKLGSISFDGHDGAELLLVNVGTRSFVIPADDATEATAANRFAPGVDLTVLPGESVMVRHAADANRWRPHRGASDVARNPAPTALADADATISIAAYTLFTWRTIDTTTANRAITLGTTNAFEGAELRITRYDTGAYTWTFTDGGSSGDVTIFPAGRTAWATWRYTNGAWQLKEFGS